MVQKYFCIEGVISKLIYYCLKGVQEIVSYITSHINHTPLWQSLALSQSKSSITQLPLLSVFRETKQTWQPMFLHCVHSIKLGTVLYKYYWGASCVKVRQEAGLELLFQALSFFVCYTTISATFLCRRGCLKMRADY